MTVIDYVTEEVQRQGHVTSALDGIERVGWMLDGWSYALLRSTAKMPKPDIADVLNIGMRVERLRNVHGYRTVNVHVRTRDSFHRFPDYDRISTLLKTLFEQPDELTPMEFYRAFEEVHPFADGNGRTGKILLNWLNGTLLKPIFPPNDFWGDVILNP